MGLVSELRVKVTLVEVNPKLAKMGPLTSILNITRGKNCNGGQLRPKSIPLRVKGTPYQFRQLGYFFTKNRKFLELQKTFGIFFLIEFLVMKYMTLSTGYFLNFGYES